MTGHIGCAAVGLKVFVTVSPVAPARERVLAGRVNGTGLTQEPQAPLGKPVSPLPFQGKGLKQSGTKQSCFGNCAELSLKVI